MFLNRIVYNQSNCIQLNRSIFCDKTLLENKFDITGRTKIALYSDEELVLCTFAIGVMWAIFHESGNSPTVPQLLKIYESHPDAFETGYFQNL